MSTDQRYRAVQAFWAMHVEAMRWCGMSVQAYARAHGISQHSLMRWRDLIDANEVEIDWRAHLHPSARPPISTSASSAAKESGVESRLTDAPTGDPPSDGFANRRRFSDEEKLAIVRESENPGATAAEICRRHGIVTSMLFRWRVQFGFGKRARAKLGGRASSTGAHPGNARPERSVAAARRHDGRRIGRWATCLCTDGQRSGCSPSTRQRAGDSAMMIVPAGVKVHLALGYTDMRKGLDGLATLVQEHLKKDPFSGHLFAFRGRNASMTEDPVLGRQRTLPVHQADRSRWLHLARDERSWWHGDAVSGATCDADRGHRLAHTRALWRPLSRAESQKPASNKAKLLLRISMFE